MSKEIRYTLKGETGSAEQRLADCYTKGTYGKGTFIGDCLSVGFIMKETGLTDIIKMLDSDPDFQKLSPLDKRNKIAMVIAAQVIPSSATASTEARLIAAAPPNEPAAPVKKKTNLPAFGS